MLSYDPASGSLTWRNKSAAATVIGSEAARKPAKNGHRSISIDGKDVLAQRLAFVLMNGKFPAGRLSFKDGNKLNLKWENLSERKNYGKINHSNPAERSAYAKAWREDPENAKRYKDKSLKSDFGITIQDYERMMIEQKGCCAVCKKPETATRHGKPITMAVDHNHATGQIRSLLCRKCNVGLGSFRDSSAILRDAADYLEFHENKERKTNIIPIPLIRSK